MEETLIAWIDWMNTNRGRLSKHLIMSKARNIVAKFEEQLDCPGRCKFIGSPGWFYRMSKRHGLRSIRCSGEGAAVDPEVVETFIKELTSLITTEGYSLKQIFQVEVVLLLI